MNNSVNIFKENESELLKDSNRRSVFFDNLKFILIMFVVLGHAVDYYTKSSQTMKNIYLFIYIFHMPLFIFISGYFSKSIVNRDEIKIEKVFSYLLLYMILKFCFFSINRFLFNSVDEKLNIFSVSGVSWYLYAMSMWLCITYIIKSIKPVFIILSSIILSLLIGYDKNVSDFLCLSRIIVFFPYFVVGYYLNEKNIVKVLRNNWLKVFTIVFCLIIIIVIMIYGENLYRYRGFLTGRNPYAKLNEPIYGGLYRLLFYGLSVIISLSIMYVVPQKHTFFSKLGTRTLQIYFLHNLILSIYNHYQFNNILININSTNGKILYICLAVILTFILSLEIFEYPFKKIMNIKLDKILK